MCVHLHSKLILSKINLTSFRHWYAGGGDAVLLPPLTSKRNPKNPSQIRIKSGYRNYDLVLDALDFLSGI